MKKKMDKGLLAILLSVICGLIIVGATLIIVNHVLNNKPNDVQSTTEEDDGWTDNY